MNYKILLKVKYLLIFIILNGVKTYAQNSDSSNDSLLQYRGNSNNASLSTAANLNRKKGIEFKIFNNLYYQTKFADSKGETIDAGNKSSYFTANAYAYYGLSSKFNVGFQLNYRAVRIDKSESSAYELFNFETTETSRNALSNIGPSVKLSISEKAGLVLQSILLLPTASDLEGSSSKNLVYLDFQKIQFFNQLFYVKSFSPKFQLFAEGGFIYRTDKDFNNETSSFTTQFKLIGSYFPIPTLSIYALGEYAPSIGNSGDFISSYYTQTGLGTKYQLVKNVEIEFLYTFFPASKKAGLGETVNFGLRYSR